MEPSSWQPQGSNGPQGQSQQPSSSGQSLLSTYPFASTTPTTHVAQHLTALTTSATNVLAPPTIMYPQYYDQSNPPPYSEYDAGTSILQNGVPDGGQDRAYWEQHQQRALRLLVEEQESSRAYTSERTSAYVQPQPQLQPQMQQQVQPAYTYPVYQANDFSQSLLQNFPYPPQQSLQPAYQPYVQQPQQSQPWYPQQYPQASQNNPVYTYPDQQQHRQLVQSIPVAQPLVQQQHAYNYSSSGNVSVPASGLQLQQTPEYFNRFLRDTTAAIQAIPSTSASRAPPSLHLSTQPASQPRAILPPPRMHSSSTHLPSTSTKGGGVGPVFPQDAQRTRTSSQSQLHSSSRTATAALPLPSTSQTFPAVHQTPQKPRAPPTPPQTDSPDPLMIGPYSRRPSAMMEQDSPERTITARQSYNPQLSSPLKRKVSDVEVHNLGSPSKRKYVPEVVLDSPRRPPNADTRDVFNSPTQSRPQPTSSFETRPSQNRTPRRRLSPYVLIPPRSQIAHASVPVEDEEYRSMTDDDYEDEDESIGGRGRRSGVKTSGKRTGERDTRAATEKLVAYLEDVFEAEDTLPYSSRPSSPAPVSSSPTATSAPSSSTFFPSRSASNEPLLSVKVIRKLTRHFEACSVRQARSRNRVPRGALSEVDVTSLSRILKILERSVRAGTDVEAFPMGITSRGEGSPSKGKRKSQPGSGKKGKLATPSRPGLSSVPLTASLARPQSRHVSTSQSQATPMRGDTENDPEDTAQDDQHDEENEDDTLSDLAIERCSKALEVISGGVLAADCCLALLTGDKLPKQFYSEDLILACLEMVKTCLTTAIYPYVEAASDIHGQTTALLHHVLSLSPLEPSLQYLSSAFQSVLALLPRIDDLISSGEHAMSESIVIGTVYIATGPFFVIDATGSGVDGKRGKGKAKDEHDANAVLGGKAGLGGLRLSALSILRTIFANHEEQRSWVIEDILTSLIKLPDIKRKGGQFKLRDGSSIHTVSALLLQLVQTTAHDVRARIRKLNRNKASVEGTTCQSKEEKDALLDKQQFQEIEIYQSGLESSAKCARSIISFLIQRSGKTKTTKDSNEAEYRAILDSLLSDMLKVLYWPEWPAASFLLSIACKFMVSSLEDSKTSSDNVSKQLALDHLGTIASTLRTHGLKARANGDRNSREELKSLDEVIASSSVRQFEKLAAAHKDVSSYLSKRSSEDQACDSARELMAATWGHDLGDAITKVAAALEEGQTEEQDEKRTSLIQRIQSVLSEVWKDDRTVDVFDVGTDAEIARIQRLAERLGAVNALQKAFEPILNVMLGSLDSAVVAMRTKALRALGQVITCDSDILRHPNVRRAIETHIADNSPAVRDAAVELIGKYVVQEPALAGDYYDKISERIADTSLGVRKRVMKLLKGIYIAVVDRIRRVDICSKLILRLQDEDTTVKDLSVQSIEELWFSDASPHRRVSNSGDGDDRVLIFMDVVGKFRDRPSLLEELLQQVLNVKEGKSEGTGLKSYSSLCDALIDRVIDSQEDSSFAILNCIRSIYLLTAAHPSVVSSSKAEILLPYLKTATTAEEQMISDNILKIFRAAIPGMPKTSMKFAQDLQRTLLPMISKPSSIGGLSALQETVACLCSVVNNLTKDYSRLITLLKSCDAKLQIECLRVVPLPAAMRTVPILVLIVALLVEHCDFDQLRKENKVMNDELKAVSPGSVSDHVYETLLSLHSKEGSPSVRAATLQCLGFLFRAHPALMMRETTQSLMDKVFLSDDLETRGRLLKIIQDFLMSESAKRAGDERAGRNNNSKKGEVDIDELVGSSNTFADSGVSSAIVQRYLRQILDGAMSTLGATQRVAFDILAFIVKQGLAHPLQCLPTLIALETSPDASLSARAGNLHAILQNKHASVLNSRFTECARASFSYQRKIAGDVVQGCRLDPTPVALLHRWYSLVKEKRIPRLELLKAFIKTFDVDSTKLSCTADDVAFIRYMAENVSALEYKTQEEVFTVIRYLTSVLSVAGMQLVESLARLDLGDGNFLANDAPGSHDSDPYPLLRASIAVGILMILKSHLKLLYGLSEDKCLRFIPGKKTAIGDKPAARLHDSAISFDRMPFAVSRMVTREDLSRQREAFQDLWAEDGVTGEPTEDMD